MSRAKDGSPQKERRYERLELGPARAYQKEWKIHDFVGTYHLTRVKNVAPVPGTTLGLEKAEKEAKAADAKRFEDQLEARAIQYKKTIKARGVGAEETTKLHVEAIIGAQIEKTDQTLHARAAEKDKKNYFSDTPEQVKRFRKNVAMNRPHYIGYAVVSTGFRSMAWQDDETGDSFVHMAVKSGFVDVLEQLLKYNADANLINKMGNAPIHEAWYQWVPPPNTADVRREQEARTCAILRHLCTWNAYPDNLHKTDGNTALHWAARLGPVKAVVILLGFKSDHTIRNKSGLTPLDVAVAHGQTEIVKVLSNWNVMKKQSQHEDFAILWKSFIADHEIPMSNDPDAKTTIYKLHMRDSVNKMSKISGDDFMIDDPLIQKARTEGILADQDIPLKPWDKKYQSARAKRVGAVAIPKGQYFGEEPLQKSRTATSLVVREELSRPVTASEEFSDGMKSPGLTLSSARMKRRNISNLYAYLINANRPQSSSKVDSIDSIPQFPVVDDGDSLDSGCIGTVPIVDFEDDGLPAQSMGTNHEERVPSAIYSRRLTSAQRIVRDAKFELCTVRPCTSSALLLSRRAKAAPLFGTEEQSSLERFLSSKHLDRPKSPPKVTDLTGDGKEAKVRDKFVRPPVTPMGAYRPVTINEVYSDNEKLYKRLQSTNFYEAKRKAEATLDSLNDALAGGAAGAVGMRGTMVPMVHARARSIEERVVPPKKMLSRTDQLNLDAAEAKALIQAEQDETKATEEDLVVAKKKGKHAAKYMSPPKKPAVIYGANRLKSAEMTTMPIQTPWSSVSATYTVNMAV